MLRRNNDARVRAATRLKVAGARKQEQLRVGGFVVSSAPDDTRRAPVTRQ